MLDAFHVPCTILFVSGMGLGLFGVVWVSVMKSIVVFSLLQHSG